ncbi:MAG TPA: hypothetical protein VE569_12165 [Acidimicrobiia bacterium]|nr:hypothetical protein [Acidimicrobiia bacterium]
MEALNAWSTLALAVIAGVALLGARGQIQEARRLRKSASRAYVTVHAEGVKETRTINLFITNAGRTHAEHVNISFDPPLEAAANHLDHQKTAGFWKQPVIPPGVTIHTALDNGPDRAESDLPMTFTATVDYESPATDETLTYSYTIDLDAAAYAVRHITLVDQDTPKQTKALETIARTLQERLGGDGIRAR